MTPVSKKKKNKKSSRPVSATEEDNGWENRRELATLFEPQIGIFGVGELRMIGAEVEGKKKQTPDPVIRLRGEIEICWKWIVRESSE